MFPKVAVVFCLLYGTTCVAKAQQHVDATTWRHIDSCVQNKKNVLQVQQQLLQIKQRALTEHQYGTAARCWYYIMQIADARNNDTLYFKNSSFVDSIINAPAAPSPLKLAMHILQAKRLQYFRQHFHSLSKAPLIAAYNTSYALTGLTGIQLDSLSAEQYKAALRLSSQLQSPPVEDWLWLSSEPLEFLFKPSLTDIIYAEWAAGASTYSTVMPNAAVRQALMLSQDDFIALPMLDADFGKGRIAAMAIYRQWMAYHGRSNPAAYYSIEAMARKNLFAHLAADSIAEKNYGQYLQRIVQSPYGVVKATGIYQLFMLWVGWAAGYNQGLSTDGPYNYNKTYKTINTALLPYYARAVTLFNSNRQLLDSFGLLRNIMQAAYNSITTPQARLQMQQAQLPGKPIAAMLFYRNLPALYMRIIKLKPGKAVKENNPLMLDSLLKLPAFTQTQQALPVDTTYQQHNTFIKLDSLPVGSYALLYATNPINDSTANVYYTNFTVTNMATLNNDSRLFVLNRATGFPIQGATVQVMRKANNAISHTYSKRVNALGYVTLNKGHVDSIRVYSHGDTIIANYNRRTPDLPETVYDPGEYDDKEEYYEEDIKLSIFTDRAIYRPGQTVYYKVIGITHNPRTGEAVVLNQQNLRFPFFKKLFAAAAKKFLQHEGKVYIRDAFDKNVDSFQIKPNKFGSFSSSFKLPQNAATGDWGFESDVLDIDNRGDGSFKVEEYKRPTFQLTVNPPAKELYAGDSFAVTIAVKSFAGALLNNVRIKYTVARNGDFESTGGAHNHEDTLLAGSALTSNSGEIMLHINDTAVARRVAGTDEKLNFYYSVNATATDETGETDEASKQITTTTQPIILSVPLQRSIDVQNVGAPLYISASTKLGGNTTKKATARLYRLAPKHITSADDTWPPTDVQLHSQAQWQQWFPGLVTGSYTEQPDDDGELIYTTSIIAGGTGKLIMPSNIIAAGNYKLVVTCVDELGRVRGTASKLFDVYNKQQRLLPGLTAAFNVMPYNSVQAGGNMVWLTGNTLQDVFSIYHLAYYTQTAKGALLHNDYDIRTDKKGLNEWLCKIPASVNGRVLLTQLYIINNQLYSNRQNVYVDHYKAAPQLIVQQYRQVVAPGTQQTFTVSIKTNNDDVAAELMTTMYDAALEKIEPHKWEMPRESVDYAARSNWESSINEKSVYRYEDDRQAQIKVSADTSMLWWLGSSTYKSLSGRNLQYNSVTGLSGKLSGLTVDITGTLYDVVVTTALGSQRRSLSLGYSTSIRIRGTSSLTSYTQPLIVLDGIVYTGDIGSIEAQSITDIIILKGADASAVYGSRAADGVLVISTKGPVVLPKPAEPAPPPAVVRKNFSETAFFYPQVHAGRDGYYTISFTLPQSVTAWKWKMLAHTKNAQFTYAEKDITSNLPLMVQPAMPKFLYQGDKLALRTRVTNLDTVDITGTLQCRVEDAVTGEDITNQIVATPQQQMAVGRSNNTAGAFNINIPAGLLHPIRIKVTAAANMYSDAEEHIIPILAKKILVAQNVPVTVQASQKAAVYTPALPADAQPYGVSLYITPKPHGALLNALPYLANYPYSCAEQTFNKLYAHALAITVARTDTGIQKAMLHNDVTQYTGTNAGALPGELNEETMPWLQAAHATAIEQQQLQKLFDTVQAHEKISEYFTALKSMQNSDGGVSWFPGGKSDFYISCYLLASFNKLQNNGLLYLPAAQQNNVTTFIEKLAAYCSNMAAIHSSNYSIEYLYAISFAAKGNTVASSATDSLLAPKWRDVDSDNIGRQAMLITATLQLTKPGSTWHNKALQQLQSLQQLAVTDEDGTRWKAISNNDDLNSQTEEQIAKLTEAYETAGMGHVTKGVITWLLQNTQQYNWGTTKATAEVVNIFNRYVPATTGTTNTLTANYANLHVTDDLFSGSRQAFAPVIGATFTDSVIVTATSNAKITGGINYHYFTATPPADKTSQGVAIKRVIQRFNDKTNAWEALSDKSTINIADKIKVTLQIQTPKALQFVFIEDKHAAAFETRNAESGYSYESGISYYASYRDAGVQFFAEGIPAGNTSINYEAIVTHTGTFTGGAASLQCIYRPGVHAYSNTYTVQAGTK